MTSETNTVTAAAEEVVLTEEETIEALLNTIDFGTQQKVTVETELEKARKRIEELTVTLETLNKETLSKMAEAERMARKLRKYNLGNEAVRAALQKQYGYNPPVREPTSTTKKGDERTPRKLTPAQKEEVFNFIKANGAGSVVGDKVEGGLLMVDILKHFKNYEKLGVMGHIKKLVEDKKVQALGTTRQRKYFVTPPAPVEPAAE